MVLLLRYGEIHLKGLNRPHFEKLLRDAVRRALTPYPQAKVSRGTGRFYVTGLEDSELPGAEAALRRVFGLHSFSEAVETEKTDDLLPLKEALAEMAREWMRREGRETATFKVETKRADKRFPATSMQISADIGGYVLEHVPGMTVDVHDPDLRLYAEVREKCYGYTGIIPGAGGLPPRSSGRAMLLLSGGIDSPAAGYLIAKRGVELHAVHFHSFPFTSEQARQKVVDLARILSSMTGPITLNVVPFTEIQTKIHTDCPPEMMVLIMRRFMMRIAAALAGAQECAALVTGESIGQVASQTLASLRVTDCVADMPVFRPLIGFDKLDIIALAESIGTYETSILPYEDCCTVFVPKHPLTNPHEDRIAKAESVLPIDELVQKAVAGTETFRVTP
ncbi:MAG: tRNA 4-thiouridine(8) synthase ThiI [Clostridia bacterium]|nr:tRNA 4-thiouridine(8) synthase ThiI [Clostridia bacterium]